MRRFVFTLATCLLFAGGVSYAQTTPDGEIDWESYTSKSGWSVETTTKLLRIECRGTAAKFRKYSIEEFAEFLYVVRSEGWLPPYDIKWCHKNGIFPPSKDDQRT